jgi:hypothetical protein
MPCRRERRTATAGPASVHKQSRQTNIPPTPPTYEPEVCGLATRLLKADNATVLPEAQVAANTFISLIGYENRGYAIVPIM